MKKFTTIIIIYFSLITFIFAQELEIGVALGISNYQGDLMARQFESQENNLAYGLFARYRINEMFAIKGAFTKGAISGDDKWANPNTGLRQRNLSFKSTITELSLTAEFNVLSLITDEWDFLNIYGFTGIAGFHFNPKTFYNGQWVELQPLGTEGQGANTYSLYQFSIPMGIGGGIRINDVTTIGFEVGLRKTFTDYLDDVSGAYPNLTELSKENELAAILSYRVVDSDSELVNTDPSGLSRGNSKNKDWYLFAGVNFSVNLSNLFAIGGGPGRYSAF